LILVAQDPACVEVFFLMLAPQEKASSVRRAEAISAVSNSRIGMTKIGGAVAIGRCEIINGNRQFEIVSNWQDRNSMSGNTMLG
jgi:hypothetical protein